MFGLYRLLVSCHGEWGVVEGGAEKKIKIEFQYRVVRPG